VPFIPLRYVKDREDIFTDYDHNDHVTNWRNQVYFLESAGIGGDRLEELKKIVSEMRYVSEGDYYTSEDHNRFVNAFKVLLKIFEAQGLGTSEFYEFKKLVESMREIKPGEYYYAEHHNKFAKAWELVEILDEQMGMYPNASGIDPHASPWAPPEGWDRVWEFTTDYDITDFTRGHPENVAYARTEFDRVIFEPPPGKWGFMTRFEQNRHVRRVAFCLRAKIYLAGEQERIASAQSIVENYVCECHFETAAPSVDSWTPPEDTAPEDWWKLRDYVSDAVSITRVVEDWVVFVVDFISKEAWIYDRNGDVRNYRSLASEPSAPSQYTLTVIEFNLPDTTVTDVEVDWIAVLY